MTGTAPHVLLVDDHASFRDLVALRLALLGWTSTGVPSVPAAIDALERETFDAIVSDHEMPGQSGLDLLAYAHHRRPELPFVLMSGLLDERLSSAAADGGAFAAVEKGELIDSLRQLLEPAVALAA